MELARAVARVISEPSYRRLGLLLVAWMLRCDSIRKPLVIELIRESLMIESQADVCQSALLLEMASGLYQEGFDQAAALLDRVPPSPIREGYQRAWSEGPAVLKELAQRAGCPSAATLAVLQSDLEEFQRVVQFTQGFGAGFRPWPNSKRSAADFELGLCESFGPIGAAGAYFSMACDQIHSGNDRMAEALITRGLYLYTALRRPALRTLAATAQAFGAWGRSKWLANRKPGYPRSQRRRCAWLEPPKKKLSWKMNAAS